MTVSVHAADADWEALRTLLADPSRPHVAGAAKPTTVTGRVAARTRSAALAALEHAGHTRLPSIPLRGKGPRITLRAAGQDARAVIQRLGNALDANIVFAPGTANRVTVAVVDAPVRSLLSAVLAALGWNALRSGSLTFVAAADFAPPDQRLSRARGPTLGLTLAGARAADALALVDAVAPHDFDAPCTGGDPMRLAIRGVTPAEALGAIQVGAAVELAPRAGAPQCPPTTAASATAPALIGIARAGPAATASAWRVGDRVAIARVGDPILGTTVERIDATAVTLARGDTIELVAAPETVADLATARLSATVVAGAESAAVVEVGDRFHIVDATTHPGVAIEPGRLAIDRRGADNVELTLAPRSD